MLAMVPTVPPPVRRSRPPPGPPAEPFPARRCRSRRSRRLVGRVGRRRLRHAERRDRRDGDRADAGRDPRLRRPLPRARRSSPGRQLGVRPTVPSVARRASSSWVGSMGVPLGFRRAGRSGVGVGGSVRHAARPNSGTGIGVGGGNAEHRRRKPELPDQPGDAGEVVAHGRADVDARVRVVDPVDGHLHDPQTVALRPHEELGVEEPGVVGDLGQERPGRVGADRLEPALRVAEARPEHDAQQRVVGARDELALRAALDVRAAQQAGAGGDAGVPGDQRRDHREQRRRGRSTGRRRCRRARTRRSSTTLSRSARPRPRPGRCTTRTSGSSSASRVASAPVPSVEPLSAMVMRHVNGSGSSRRGARGPVVRARAPRRARARRRRARRAGAGIVGLTGSSALMTRSAR